MTLAERVLRKPLFGSSPLADADWRIALVLDTFTALSALAEGAVVRTMKRAVARAHTKYFWPFRLAYTWPSRRTQSGL